MTATRRSRGLALAGLAAALFLLPGCVAVTAAAVGAGAVAATGEDTAQVDLAATPAEVYEAATGVLERRGEVTAADPSGRQLEAKVEGSSVEVSVFPVGKYTRLRVKARQVVGAFPDLDLARGIATDVSHALP